jgi:hypothetical protein
MNELKIPGRILQPRCPWGVGHHWLNAGIARAWGKRVIMYRVNRMPSLLAVSVLDEHWVRNEAWFDDFEVTAGGVATIRIGFVQACS